MTQKVLLIGDFHLTGKGDEIPEEFMKAARESDVILCTGDLVDERILEKLMDSTEEFHIVRGEEDYLDLPEQDIARIEDLKFGMIHGHQLESEEGEEIEDLVEMGELMKVDVLVTGHSHQPFRTEKEGLVLFNPGSATGADGSGKTCFLLEVGERSIVDSKILKG
ncbi:MAG: YfcE family phosphodiesterase [Candidatus Aenigmatarchaeota archaeon]